MESVQNFTPPDFQAKNFTPSISPNFNSFSKKKNEWKWRNLHRWEKFYTAAGSDGMDKFHLCHVVDVGPKQKPYFEICKGLNENQITFFWGMPTLITVNPQASTSVFWIAYQSNTIAKARSHRPDSGTEERDLISVFSYHFQEHPLKCPPPYSQFWRTK